MSAAPKFSPRELENLIPSGWRSHIQILGENVTAVDPTKKSILVVEGWEPCRVLETALNQGTEHICQADGGALESETLTASLMAAQPEIFLKNPVAAILDPKGCQSNAAQSVANFRAQFHQASEKDRVVDGIREYLGNAGKAESLINDVSMVADEMFTNAVFNAPFVDLKTGFNPGVDRSDWSVAMDPGFDGEILMGADEQRLVIACRDPYGSLDVKQFLTRVFDCCQTGISANMRMGNGGAGIGSFMVFNAGSSLYLGVCRGVMTVVAVSIHWKWSGRKRSEALKNVHVFQL